MSMEAWRVSPMPYTRPDARAERLQAPIHLSQVLKLARKGLPDAGNLPEPCLEDVGLKRPAKLVVSPCLNVGLAPSRAIKGRSAAV